MVEGTKWLAVIFLIVVVACGTETIEKSEVGTSSAAATQSQISPTNTQVPTVEPTVEPMGEPTLTPTEIALLSTIEAMLEEAEERSTPAPTSTPQPTKTATSIPTATPQRVQQILPSLALTMAAEPQFPDLPVAISGRCGDPIVNLYVGFGCYFEGSGVAFFVNEEYHGCIYSGDGDLPQCEAWLWELDYFCIQRVQDESWNYRWEIRLTCTTSPSGPTPTPIPESPLADVEGLGHCQNDWFLVVGEGCLIRETTLFFWVTSDNDGCVIGEGLEEPDCFQRDYFKILQRGGHTIPINIQRGTDSEKGPGWRLYVIEPIEPIS